MAKRFRPSPGATLLLAALTVAFLGLGRWQLERAEEKSALQNAFEQAPSIEGLPGGDAAARFSRVRVEGRFDSERHFLLDNQVYLTRPGVHVLTPFGTTAGETILVNRGWLPLAADRRQLPPVPTPSEATKIQGILDLPYRPGKRLGEADRLQRSTWPQLITYPDLGDMGAALGLELYPQVVLLAAEHPAGFEDRDWRPVQTDAAKHRARALQWFTFAAAAVVIGAYLGFKRGHES